MKVSMTKITSLVAVLSWPALSAHGNLIANGDFEAGNTGFSTEYRYQAVPHNELPVGDYGIATNPTSLHWASVSFGDHTSGDGLMMVVNGKTTPDSVVWSQTVSVPSNTSMDFSMWASIWENVGYPPPTLELLVDGVQVGTSFVPSGPSGTWSQFTAEWVTGGSTEAELVVNLASSHNLGNDFVLDDLMLTPEPGSLLLVMLGGLLMKVVSRRSI